MSSWLLVLLEPAKVILTQMGQFLMKTLAVIFILIIGRWISKLIKTTITRVLKGIKFDNISEDAGIDNFLAKGGISYSLSELIGIICYWLAILITVMVALTPFNLITPDLLDKIVSYVPNVIAAIFILIFGMFVSTILRNIVRTAANNTGLSQANILGKIVEIVIMVFATAIALEQLNIGAKIIELIISIVLGAIGLGLALAFGLGCKDIAGKSLSEFIDKLKKK